MNNTFDSHRFVNGEQETHVGGDWSRMWISFVWSRRGFPEICAGDAKSAFMGHRC